LLTKDVDLAEGLFSLSKEMFDVCLSWPHCPNGNGPAAALGNLIHYSVGSFFTGSIVDNDGCAFGSELLAMSAPIPFEAPVTTATFPVQFSIFHCVSFIFYFCVHFYFFSIDLDFLCVDAFSIHSVNG